MGTKSALEVVKSAYVKALKQRTAALYIREILRSPDCGRVVSHAENDEK
jgi:hypothetical protein